MGVFNTITSSGCFGLEYGQPWSMGKILVEQWIRVATSDRMPQQLQNVTDVDQTLNIRSKYKSLKWIIKQIVNAHVKFALLCHIDMPGLMICTPL